MYVTPLSCPVVDTIELAREHSRGMVLEGALMSRGYVPRDYTATPLGAMQYASPFDLPLIPRSEWRDRIEERDRTRSRLSDHRRLAQIPAPYQNGIPYCWIWAQGSAMTLLRAWMGLPYKELSPTGPGCLIKNYRKVGGNTPEGIKHLAEFGMTTVDHWPHNKLDRRYDTPEMRAEARKNRILEWWEMTPNNFDQMATALLHGLPVVMGLYWWMHMICGMDLVALPNGKYGVKILNSHGPTYGDNGEAVLTEEKATAFDQVTPRVITTGVDEHSIVSVLEALAA